MTKNLIKFFGLLLLLNIVFNYLDIKWDCSEEGRFTLDKQTINAIANTKDHQIVINNYLVGDLPADFKKLKYYTSDLVKRINNENAIISINEVEFEALNPQDKKEISQLFYKKNVNPYIVNIKKGDESIEKKIYAYLQIIIDGNSTFISLLPKSSSHSLSPDELILQSIQTTEEKIANLLSNDLGKRKRIGVVFQGGEKKFHQLYSFLNTLDQSYDLVLSDYDSISRVVQDSVSSVIYINPYTISNSTSLIMDQLILRGIPAIFLVDYVDINLDSMARHSDFYVLIKDKSIEKLLFSYGIKLIPELVKDYQCASIPQVVSGSGQQVQTMFFPFPYFALASTYHLERPIVDVWLQFPTHIDTLVNSGLKYQVLLNSSPQTNILKLPNILSFEFLHKDQKPSTYNSGSKILAINSQGSLKSHFRNRIFDIENQVLKHSGLGKFVEKSTNSNVTVVADAQWIENLYDIERKSHSPMAYNNYEKRIYDNNEKFLQYIISISNGKKLIQLTQKTLQLRKLDPVLLQNNGEMYKYIALLLPVLFILVIFIGLYVYRKRKYYDKFMSN